MIMLHSCSLRILPGRSLNNEMCACTKLSSSRVISMRVIDLFLRNTLNVLAVRVRKLDNMMEVVQSHRKLLVELLVVCASLTERDLDLVGCDQLLS